MERIKDIKNNQKIDGIFRVERVNVSTGSNGANYMIVHLADRTGRIEGRKWLMTAEDKELIQPNLYIYLTGAVANEFRNNLQLKINDYKMLDESELANYDYKMSDFYMVAPVDINKEYKNLMGILEKVTNTTYREITIGLLKKYETIFLTYPAAMSIHHNVVGGLFWHSYTLVRDALAIKDNYAYAAIDWDLVVCGAILHDIGKVIEINGQAASDYTLEGKLLGHISIGNTEVNKMAEELNLYHLADGSINPSVTLLQHMILASHGKHEYGSPVEPVIIEAVILSTFDNLDARIFRTSEETAKIELGQWTPRIMSEDGKFFLKHYEKPKKKEAE